MPAKQTKEDREWAKKVKARDGHECSIHNCKETEYLNAHHIIPKEQSKFRYNTLNGITLCPSHHRFSRKLSAHQNPLAFFFWLEKHRPYLFHLAKSRCSF